MPSAAVIASASLPVRSRAGSGSMPGRDADVLARLCQAQEGGETRSCEVTETAYVRFFAREVADFMLAQAKIEGSAANA